ncbi:probable transposable element [Lasallia pustulata]|uniref:Probable transposable element n=1 Tax=Lasallia pustulata TaxID=136370 RepID=A0A1W5DBX3_9LECA|nr:probable transposable element [Lasallia pustulata]
MPLTEFSSKLAKRFKMTMMKALEQLNKEHYSLSDAYTNREPQGYLQNMMRYAQAAKVTDLLAQLTWAWQEQGFPRDSPYGPRSLQNYRSFYQPPSQPQYLNPAQFPSQPQFSNQYQFPNLSLPFSMNNTYNLPQQNQGASSGPQPVTQVQSGPRPGQLQITAGITEASPNRSYNRSNSQGLRSSRNNYQGQRGNGNWGNYGNPQAAYHGSFEEAYPGEGWDSGYHNQEAHNYHRSQMDHFDGTYPGNSGPLQDVQNENHSLNPSQSKMDVIEGQENRPPGPNMDANYTDAYHIEIPPKPLAYTCCDCRTKGKRVRITYQTQSSDQENQAKVGIFEPAGSLVNGPETTAAEVGAHLVFSESSSPKVVCPVVESDAPMIAGNVDSTVPFICVKNSSWKEKILPQHTRVGTVTKYEEEEYYPVDVEDHSLAAKYTPVEVDVSKPETKLTNGVTIYGDAETVAVLADVISAFPRTWSDSGDMVNTTPEEHLSIPLTVDWNTSTAAKLSHQVYPMGPNERAVIDEEFDKMHEQGRMSWSVKPTPFSFPVFVVWKTVFYRSEKKPTKKGRVIVDIRGLNKITTTDAYPIPLQSKIISAVHGSKFIKTEKEAFKFLQKSFDEPTFLTFFDRQRQLYIDINGSKQWGFGIMVYHVKGDPGGNDFPRKSIQPVMFLSKLLNNAERNYWPTELEVAALV